MLLIAIRPRRDGLRHLIAGTRLPAPGSVFDWPIEDRDLAAVARGMRRFRVCLAVMAVIGAAAVPGMEIEDRSRVVAMVAAIWIAWSIAAGLLAGDLGRPSERVAAFA